MYIMNIKSVGGLTLFQCLEMVRMVEADEKLVVAVCVLVRF